MARHRAPLTTPRATRPARADRRAPRHLAPLAVRTPLVVLVVVGGLFAALFGLGTAQAFPTAPEPTSPAPVLTVHPAGGSTADVPLPIGTDHIPGLPAVGTP